MPVRIDSHVILGAEITIVIARAIEIAQDIGECVGFGFNGVEVEVAGLSDPDLIYRDWRRAMSGYITGKVGPAPAPRLTKAEAANDRQIEAENQKRRDIADAEYRRKEADGKATLAAELVDAPAMTRDEAVWAQGVQAQGSSSYGLGVFEFAETWARLMQKRMAGGARLSDVADETCTLADKGYGITGYMYGCAVSALAGAWAYGDDLRRWHNGKYGVADDQPGTVNPAVLTVAAPSPSPFVEGVE